MVVIIVIAIFSDKLSYGGCMLTSECSKTTCQDLVSLLPAELQSMAFSDCNKECCGKPLCNDVINTVNADPTNEPPQAHKPLTLSESKNAAVCNKNWIKIRGDQ